MSGANVSTATLWISLLYQRKERSSRHGLWTTRRGEKKAAVKVETSTAAGVPRTHHTRGEREHLPGHEDETIAPSSEFPLMELWSVSRVSAASIVGA